MVSGEYLFVLGAEFWVLGVSFKLKLSAQDPVRRTQNLKMLKLILKS